MSTKPVPAESADGIERARATESVAAAEAEALGPRVEREIGYGSVYGHENESPSLKHCEGAWVKSMRCGEGILARVIRPLDRAPPLDILMRIYL